ncbi:unnamed protein product, partial [Ectocarpus sp. 13 AM-2016]
ASAIVVVVVVAPFGIFVFFGLFLVLSPSLFCLILLGSFFFCLLFCFCFHSFPTCSAFFCSHGDRAGGGHRALAAVVVTDLPVAEVDSPASTSTRPPVPPFLLPTVRFR